MAYYVDIKTREGDTTTTKYKTRDGATAALCRLTGVPGYQSVSLTVGEHPCQMHVIAEVKREGRWIGRVWC